jgi:hypothetical protein
MVDVDNDYEKTAFVRLRKVGTHVTIDRTIYDSHGVSCGDGYMIGGEEWSVIKFLQPEERKKNAAN